MSTRSSASTTFELCYVPRALTPPCCWPVAKETIGTRLVLNGHVAALVRSHMSG